MTTLMMPPRELPKVPVVPSQQDLEINDDKSGRPAFASEVHELEHQPTVQRRRQTTLQDSEAQSRRDCERIVIQFNEAINSKDLRLSTWERIAPRIKISWGRE